MRSLRRNRAQNGNCDPAPSRWAWRMQRLMLTPLFLLFLRAGIPMAIAFGTVTWWLSDEARRGAVVNTLVEARTSFESRPEFMVKLLSIDGANERLAEDIRLVVPFDFPQSSFDINLGAVRDDILKLAPVKSATVRIKPGGVLQVDVVPRTPVVIWRTQAGLKLIDVTGIYVEPLNARMDRPDLPLIAGEGADAHVKEALDLFRAAAPLGGRLRGIVRVGERRWDIVLDRGQHILLPDENAVQALERVIALDGAQDILSRDVKRVDLRLGTRPTVLMSEYATEKWWEIRQISGQ
ncbi:MAG: cell division protein FtsQ/DivIB [Roseobacter sp.]